MLPVQFGEVNQIARVAEYVHSSSSDNESGEERSEGQGGGGTRDVLRGERRGVKDPSDRCACGKSLLRV